jgi:membrane associated rhomboid family serine protease
MRYRSYGDDGLMPVLAIIVACFALYLATVIANFFGYSLIGYLGMRPASLLSQPWTIVTSLFMHGGIWHLLANMLTLYFFGTFLQRLVGAGTFLLIYFVGGIVGNILFILLGPPYAVVVGASGAIFALGGTLAVLAPMSRVYIIPIPVPVPLWVAVIGGFLILSFAPGIAWQGHLGGLITGVVAGFILRRRRRFVIF